MCLYALLRHATEKADKALAANPGVLEEGQTFRKRGEKSLRSLRPESLRTLLLHEARNPWTIITGARKAVKESCHGVQFYSLEYNVIRTSFAMTALIFWNPVSLPCREM